MKSLRYTVGFALCATWFTGALTVEAQDAVQSKTAPHEGRSGDQLPLGEPMLAWSFNRDGEILPGLLEKRDREMGISTVEKRNERTDLQKLAHPQSGVDELKGKFGRPTRDIPGVIDKRSAGSQGATSPAR